MMETGSARKGSNEGNGVVGGSGGKGEKEGRKEGRGEKFPKPLTALSLSTERLSCRLFVAPVELPVPEEERASGGQDLAGFCQVGCH